MATAPRKMSRSSPKAAPLAPGDPSATNTATYPGPNGLGNTIETNTNYTMGQEDRCIVVVQSGATIGLPPEPLLGYPVFIVADGGIVTVTGSIRGGSQTLAQGSVGIFIYSSISGEWSKVTGSGGGGGGGVQFRVSASVPYAGQINCTLEVDLTGGAVPVALPAMSAGSTITIKVLPNGSDPSADNLTITPPTGKQLEVPLSPGEATPGQLGGINTPVVVQYAGQKGLTLVYEMDSTGSYLYLV